MEIRKRLSKDKSLRGNYKKLSALIKVRAHSLSENQEKKMFQFPDGLYTDVRVEDVFESKIQITLKNLENLKEQSYKAAFIRVFDGGRWSSILPQPQVITCRGK